MAKKYDNYQADPQPDPQPQPLKAGDDPLAGPGAAAQSAREDAKGAGLKKFEWPNNPFGIMVLNDKLGFPGDKKDIQFTAGFFITDDPDILAALAKRAEVFKDVFEVPLSTNDRTHASTYQAPPPIPPVTRE